MNRDLRQAKFGKCSLNHRRLSDLTRLDEDTTLIKMTE